MFSNLDCDMTMLPMRVRKSDQCYLAVTAALPAGDVDILNAWVKPAEDYVRPSQRVFRSFFRASKSPHRMILGDLNQNAIFDANRRLGLFKNTEKLMRNHRMRSLYHSATKEKFGHESRPTHYLTYAKSRPYHLDYIFVSDGLTLNGFALFPDDPWTEKRRSDHLPLRAILKLPQ